MTRLCKIASESRRDFDHLNLVWRGTLQCITLALSLFSFLKPSKNRL